MDLSCDNFPYATALLMFGNFNKKIYRGNTWAWAIFIRISLNKAGYIVFCFLIWFCRIIRITPLGYQDFSKNTMESCKRIKETGYFSSIIEKYSYFILSKWIVSNSVFSEISEFPALVN